MLSQLYDTPEKLRKRGDELEAEDISRLKRRGGEMSRIILDSKFGIDSDYNPADHGTGARGEHN